MYYGFDIGGTKIALGVFDKQRRLQWETRVPTPRDSYDAFLDAVCNLVTEVLPSPKPGMTSSPNIHS